MQRTALFFAGLAGLLAVGCGRPVVFPAEGSEWTPASPLPFAGQPRLAITDNADDTLAFVSTDLPTPTLLGLMPVGDIPVELEGPHHLAASPTGDMIFVGLSNYVPGSGTGPHGAHGIGTVPGSLIKLRSRDLSRVGEATIDRSPGDVILSRDGRTAYVTHYDLLRLQTQVQKALPEEQGFSTVAVVDTATMARPPLYPVCATGHGMVLSSDEKTLYVTCALTDQLAILDLTTHKATRISVGPGPGKPLQPNYAPYAVSRSPKDGALWISCNRSGDVRAFDPTTGQMDPARIVFVNGVAMFSAFLSDGTTLVVPHQGDDKVSVVDTAATPPVERFAITLPSSSCLNAHVVLMVNDTQGYVVCEGDHAVRRGSVVAIDLQQRAVLGYVEVGLFPDGVVLLPPSP